MLEIMTQRTAPGVEGRSFHYIDTSKEDRDNGCHHLGAEEKRRYD